MRVLGSPDQCAPVAGDCPNEARTLYWIGLPLDRKWLWLCDHCAGVAKSFGFYPQIERRAEPERKAVAA